MVQEPSQEGCLQSKSTGKGYVVIFTFFSFFSQNGIFIEASNVQYESNDIVKQLDDSAHIPSLDDHSGTNYFDRSTQMLHLVSK